MGPRTGQSQDDDAELVEIVGVATGADHKPLTRSGALTRMTAAENTLRAIGAGEVDAFLVSDGGSGRRVFTLSTADRPYRRFVENMREGAATVSPSGLILYANQRLGELLARSIETIVGALLATFVSGGLPDGIEGILGPDGLGTIIELELLDGAGVAVPVLVGSSLLEADGSHLICLTLTDLTAQKAQERQIALLTEAQTKRMIDLQDAQAALTQQATHDALTGLPNRALLVDRIDQALSHSKRSGRCTAVFFVDLDRFKHVNDSQGHAAGDAMLRRVGERLVALVRPMDTVARIGGDEFVILAPDLDSHLHAVDISVRLIAGLRRGPDPGDAGERVMASIGISVSVGGNGAAETLLNEADLAMYQAKSLGGERAEVFDTALGRQMQERSAARRMLQSALDDRRIVVLYQPIICLSTGRVAGFEALARVAQPDGSIVLPAAFISVAEDSGLVVPLGEQVLEMAIEESLHWQPVNRGASRPSVAVNLSSRQLEPRDLATILRERLEQTGLDPSRLHLELTETAVMNLHPDVLDQLERIRDLGAQIGLDDFGTGYASLTHLRRLPLTFVKIDQTFVQSLGTEQEDESIVSAVVDLAANLGLRSIAEGVETHDQLHRLRELGCDQAQGYLFARPAAPSDVPGLIGHPPW